MCPCVTMRPSCRSVLGMQTSLYHAVLKQALGALFCAALSFVLVLVLARAMGPLAFGDYVAVLNGATLGLIVVEGGWAQWLYRERAVAGGSAWHSLMGMGTAHVLLTTVALALLGMALGGAGVWAAVWACMGLVAWMNLASARMRGEARFGVEALWQSAGRVVSAVLILWVVWGLGLTSATAVFWAWSAGLLVVLALGARRWLVLPQWQGLPNAYPQAAPFVVVALANAWLLKGDMVLLGGGLVSKDALSYYAACTRLTEAGVLLFAPLGNVLLRRFAETAGGRQAGGQSLLWCVVAGVVVLGMLAVGLAAAWGDELMARLFGASYSPAGALLPWVLLMLPFALGSAALLQWLTARHLERWVAGWSALAGLLLWWGLGHGVGVWGPQGAAMVMAWVHACLFVALLMTALRVKPR